MIRLENISFSYGERQVLDHFSLALSEGKKYCIRGRNGCGKSTLLRILSGLSFPQGGTYILDGDTITEKALRNKAYAKAFHRRIGYLFQDPSLQLFTSSVEDEIAFGLFQLGYDEDTVRNMTDSYIQRLDLEQVRLKPPFILSGGEKKRTALAAVLSMEPDVLLLDEPLGGLDEQGRSWLKHFIQSMEIGDRILVFTTHDGSLRDLADEVIDMNPPVT